MRRVVLAALVASTAACSSHSHGEAQAHAAAAARPIRPHTTVDLLRAMAQLAGFVADRSYLDDWAAKIDHGQAQIDAYIDEILGTERFSGDIIPSLVFGAYVNVRNYWALPSGYILKRNGDGPYYLRAPCTPAEAVVVNPWWDLASEVRVCPDSYRPDKWQVTTAEQSYRTKMVMECDSQVGSPEGETEPLCGCGPNLIRCLRDEEQYDEMNRSLIDEVKRTTAYVVQHDMPMASLFTSNETFRDRNVETYYRRQKIGSLQTEHASAVLADLVTWPQGGKWAPREEVHPGQHAGVLTSPQILHWLPDRRQRQRGYYEILWCNLRNSFGATTQKVLELNAHGNNFFVYDGWQKLAHTDLCTNCHARLDYGFQFFLGYPDSRASTHYVPALQSTQTGEFYARDIDDKRGEAPLLPIEFAKLATQQPEFNECMTSHFASYVLGERATAEDVQAISDVVSRVGTFKAPMKLALQLYAKKWREEAGTTAPAPAPNLPSAPVAAGKVRVSPELRALIDHDCSDCHDEHPYTDDPDGDSVPFDFRGAELPRPVVVGMLDMVAFGMMPKKAPLEGAAREKAVHLLVDTLWADADARAEAEAYYMGRDQGLPAQDVDNALYTIGMLARTETGSTWGLIERAIWSEQATITPGFLATTGLEALRACSKTSGGRRDILEACLERATSPDVLTRWPPPSTNP